MNLLFRILKRGGAMKALASTILSLCFCLAAWAGKNAADVDSDLEQELQDAVREIQIQIPKIEIPEIQVQIPPTKVHVPEIHIPALQLQVPVNIHIPEIRIPEIRVEIPKIDIHIPKSPE
jgi:hypothetical protein